ncbi:HGGxSTG domain-containing protein [Legionella fairfieldensis]|uniref:HGGxSTG domain-containing protein n=1 Tax=Legionella fairfieldensis TaxID=45064 RepID=UPI0004919540|nr:HGGxSTG domain-containing protein [Legionella fairfieldensis]
MFAFNKAPRCGARAKVSNGKPCRCPAMKGKSRCRLHGGAKGSGAPLGNANALVHGGNTAEARAFKQQVRQTIQLSKELLNELN